MVNLFIMLYPKFLLRLPVLCMLSVSIILFSCKKEDNEKTITRTDALSAYSYIEIPDSTVDLDGEKWPFEDQKISKDRTHATFYLSKDFENYITVYLEKNNIPTGKVSGHINELEFEEVDFDLEIEKEKNTNVDFAYSLKTTHSGKAIHIYISMFKVGGLGSSKWSVSGKDVTLNGTIGFGIWNQVLDLYYRYPEVTNIIFGDVPGSTANEIYLKAGYLIRKAGYTTQALPNSYIASGGVDFFLAGAERILPNQWRSEEFGFFVHGWCCSASGLEPSEVPEDAPEHRHFIEYSDAMLGTGIGREFYFFTLHAAPSYAIHRMTDAEIKKYKIGTD